MTLLQTAVLVVIALLTATLSGVVGMGGGVILLGVMASMMPAAMVVPIHGVVQLGSNCTRTVVFFKHVNWTIFKYYAPAMIIGVFAATMLWSGDKLTGFKPLIGAFILLFLLSRKFKPTWKNPPMPA